MVPPLVEAAVNVVAVQVQQPAMPPVNSVIEIGDELQPQQQQPMDVPMANGDLNNNDVIYQQQAMVQQQPPLFDMDLEKMHTELYKGRYLTPQDFLDDVGKMVHNADVRSHEDLDRLYKAQAMFTAAQVSIQEFDPQLKLECERIAVRERKRREERRREKEKKEKEKEWEREKEREKEKEEGGQNGQGARRSARNNGQQPELTITDPVKLERRLKRQRPNGAGSDSQPSEEESADSAGGAEGRDAKRTRMLVDGEGSDDRDPIGMHTPPLHPLQPRVHFAAPEIIQPIPRLGQLLPRLLTPSPKQMVDGDVHMVDGTPTHPPPSRSRGSGFDPSLLNPLSPSEEPGPFFVPSSSTSSVMLNGPPCVPPPPKPVTPPKPITDPFNPLFIQDWSMIKNWPGGRRPSWLPPDPVRPKSHPKSRSKTPEPEKAPSPVPMVVERPRTPLPDFHVDEELVAELQRCLRDDTADLTIEELEQLRATCLGNVWRHRVDWDRDALVKELLDSVREFLSEVNFVSSP